MQGLDFIYGTMGAGKTAALLAHAGHLELAGHSPTIFTSVLDDRGGSAMVASRNGHHSQAQVYTQDTSFDRPENGPGYWLIDEAQFLTPIQVHQLHRLSAEGHARILCYGLRSDFRGMPFEGSSALLVLADMVMEIPSLCGCGSRASMNLRLDENGHAVRHGQQIMIGGESRYKGVCPRCFYEG